jgi:hypothetical protein
VINKAVLEVRDENQYNDEVRYQYDPTEPVIKRKVDPTSGQMNNKMKEETTGKDASQQLMNLIQYDK